MSKVLPVELAPLAPLGQMVLKVPPVQMADKDYLAKMVSMARTVSTDSMVNRALRVSKD